jgi:hypothetical protein
MGWLWSDKKTDAPTSTPIETPMVAEPPTAQSEAAPAPIQQQLSLAERQDADLQQFMKELEAEFEGERQQRIQSRTSGVLKHTSPLPDDISPDSLYPSEIHCRSAFDYAMFCQSFGGQFVNVYRYGSFRSCSNHWNDFWLCMRARNYPEAERKRVIKDHYRTKAIKYKTGPSSEDIWKVRTEPVKDAFQDSLEDLEAKIEKWKEANPEATDPWAGSNSYTYRVAKGASTSLGP